MTNKLVSFIFLLALVATSILAVNAGQTVLTSYEYKSTIVSQVNNHDASLQSGQHNSVSTKLSTVNDQPQFAYTNYNTTFTTDQSEYKPGDSVNVTGTTDVRGINGTLSWSITSPLNEQVYSPTKSATNIFFNDPQFKDANTTFPVDWQKSTAGLDVNTTYGNLNITSSTPGVLSYDSYHDIKGTFLFTFNYLQNSTTVSNNMTLNYWNGTQVNQVWLNATNDLNTNVTFSQALTIDTTNPAHPLALNITIPSTSPTQRWIIFPMTISYAQPDVLVSDVANSGALENVWIHGSNQKQRDIIKVNYFVQSGVTISNPEVSFNFTLPQKQLYLGNWQLDVKVNPVDQGNNSLGVSHDFYIPILVKYDLYFDVAKQYVYRGTNTTDQSSIYVDETNKTSIFSPTDKIAYVGQIFTNVTNNRDNLDSSYFTDLNGFLNSNTTIKGTQNFNWTDTGFSSYYQNDTFQQDTLQNLLPISLKNNYTWIIQSTIPERGIYGQVDRALNITFGNTIPQVNASNGQNYFTNINATINLAPLTVQFDLNVSSYNIPFNRIWFLTEFMEGNFSVNDWHTNLSYVKQFDNSTNNQTYQLQLNIPASDLGFSVFLENNATSTIEQELQVQLLSDGQTFYFGGSISSNLNILNPYHLAINWENPKYSAEGLPHKIEFTQNPIPVYNIKGTFTVQIPLTLIQFRQGDNFKVKFNVTIDQLNNKPASGLHLNAVVLNSTTLIPQVIEADGVYNIIMTIPYKAQTGIFTIQIYKTSTSTLLGSFQFEILPAPIDPQDVTTVIPFVYSLLGSVLALLVLVGFLVLVMRYRKQY